MTQVKPTCKAGLIVVAVAAFIMLADGAAAQMFEQPRQFRQRDGAGLAVFMKSFRENRNNNVTARGVSGDSTILVCGGGSGSGGATSSGSTANSSCVILNNSDASTLGLGQHSDGDQSATATANSETNNSTSTADAVTNILQQNNAQ